MDEELRRRLDAVLRAGDLDAVVDLGDDTWDGGDVVGALGCFRAAADAGSAEGWYRVACVHVDAEDWTEARLAFEQAIAAGYDGLCLWCLLGFVLEALGDLAAAMSAYDRSAAEGDPHGDRSAGFLHRLLGDRESALTRMRAAAAAGDEQARGALACWAWDETRDPGLEAELRAGADHYHGARSSLGQLLRATGRVEEAREVLEVGVLHGEEDSMLVLGNLLRDELGDVVAAEAAYRAAADLGDSHAQHNLGTLLLELGRSEEALHCFRIAAAGGSHLALEWLRDGNRSDDEDDEDDDVPPDPPAT